MREKLGDDGAEALVQLLNDSRDEQKSNIVELVGEKFERRLSEEIGSLEVRLSEKIAAVDNKISDTKSELVKWMFIFWIGQVGMMLGILFAFFKK